MDRRIVEAGRLMDQERKNRIVRIATLLVDGQIERGEVEDTEEAILAATPRAVMDAREILNAVEEWVS